MAEFTLKELEYDFRNNIIAILMEWQALPVSDSRFSAQLHHTTQLADSWANRRQASEQKYYSIHYLNGLIAHYHPDIKTLELLISSNLKPTLHNFVIKMAQGLFDKYVPAAKSRMLESTDDCIRASVPVVIPDDMPVVDKVSKLLIAIEEA